MADIKQTPTVHAPSDSTKYDWANESDKNVVVSDDVWLTRFHTIRNYAIRRVIEKELPIVKKAFMRRAKFGDQCAALLLAKDFHRVTIKYLLEVGFTFMPAFEMRRNFDGSCAYYYGYLPLCCEDKKMNAWICEIRQKFMESQHGLAQRHCYYIKKKFEKAAKKCKSKIVIHENYYRNGEGGLMSFIQCTEHNQHYVTLSITEKV